MTNTLLGIPLQKTSKKEVLEKIEKYIESQAQNSKLKTQNSQKYLHVVSLNPENVVIAQGDPKFKKIVQSAQITINDGVGIKIAARILGISGMNRTPGVDLAEELVKLADKESLKVMLIGGKSNLALRLSQCYSQKYPKLRLIGFEGIKDISKTKKRENEQIFSIVRQHRPHLILAAFGSPFQEKWFEANSSKLSGIVCMGVGGGFDFLAGRVPRAPLWVRNSGLEWLFRLFVEPWRWRRQLRLVKFVGLVIRQKLNLL